MKKFFKAISVICAVMILGVGCYYLYSITLAPKKYAYYVSEPGYNAGDMREVVGIHPYVFVGYIEETHDYNTERFKREFPETIKKSDIAWTECDVKVIKNIKGNLTEGVIFPLYKSGGLSKSLMYIETEQNSTMPESKKYYIFFGHAYEDGTVTVGDWPGIVELENGISGDNFESSKLYQEYVEAAENQIKNRNSSLHDKFLSKNDKNQGDGSHNTQIQQEILRGQSEKEVKEKQP